MTGSLFSRDGGDEPDPDGPVADEPAPKEGVRLIGADEAAQAVEKGAAAKRLGDDEPRYGDRPVPPPDDVKPALRFPLAEDEEPDEIERPKPAPVPRREESPSGENPVLSVGPPTGETELPHWTEPATGDVPRVVIGDVDETAEDQAAWTAYASGGPRWRDQNSDWEAGDFSDLAEDLAGDDAARVGALDTAARPTQEEFLSFEDLEVPEAELPRAATRGSAADPIRIGVDRAAATPGAAPGAAPTGPAGRTGRPTAKKVAVRKRIPSEPTDDHEPTAPTGGGGRDLPTAIVVGLGIAAVGIVCFVIGPRALVPLIALILLVCAGEFFASTRRAGLHPLTPLGLVAVVGLALATWAKGEAGIALVLFLIMLVATVWYVVGLSRDRPLLNLGTTVLGVVYIGVLGSFASLILKIGPVSPSDGGTDQGTSILLLAVISAVGYDVFGYVLGSRFGHTTFTSISPNKTVEGLALGCGLSVVAVVVVGSVFGPFGFGQLIVFGLLCAFAAPLGDLFESLIKRDIGIKDTSNVLPGHGGVLDRFDGLLFVLPTAFFLSRILLSL
jgi:phosphatidate cytidylyltransferase